MRHSMKWAVWLALPVLALAGVGIVLAQTPEPPPKSPETREFEETFARWRALVGRLWELDIDYRTHNDPQRREAIKKEYDPLVEQGKKQADEVIEAAIVAFVKAKAENADLLTFLIDVFNAQMQAEQYESALRLVQSLIDNEVAEDYKLYDLYTAAGTAAYLCNDFELARKHLAKAKEYGKLPVGTSGVDSFMPQGSGDFNAGDYYVFAPQYIELWKREKALRDFEQAANDLPRVVLRTNKGEIEIELFENEAPNTVANFIKLVEEGFYDGLGFYRVEAGKWAKAGDPKGDGTGGPPFIIPDEWQLKSARAHFRGSVSMDTTGPHTGGSRFVITFEPSPRLDGRQTVFGRVIRGMDVLAKLQRRIPRDPMEVAINPHRNIVIPPADVIESAKVIRKRSHPYEVTRFPLPPKQPPSQVPIDR